MSAARIQANVKTAYTELAQRVGRGLAAAAIAVVTEHQRRLNVSNPRPHVTPSRKGEYPRKQTGFGQANVYYQPTDPGEIGTLGHVDVGYGQNAFYMQALANRGRKGVEDTVKDMRSQLEAIVRKVASGGGGSGGAGK